MLTSNFKDTAYKSIIQNNKEKTIKARHMLGDDVPPFQHCMVNFCMGWVLSSLHHRQALLQAIILNPPTATCFTTTCFITN